MRLAYNTDGTAMYTSSPPTYNNPNGGAGGARHAGENTSLAMTTAEIDGSGGVAVKRKRGRPRKHPVDVHVPISILPPSQPPVDAGGGGGGFSSPATLSPGNKPVKPRGRPPGSLNKPKQPAAPAASGSPGVGFMPHILDVKAGQDVLQNLMAFSKNSTRALCVLSANGAVSNVTLMQSTTSAGTVTYEGRFEILSLSGSSMASEVGGQPSRLGGFSVALSGPDGRVLGGNVAGLLIAASPVQVIVGSFVPASQKPTRSRGNNEAEVVNANAPQRGESSGGSGSGGGLPLPLPLHHRNSNPHGLANMPWR